MPQWTDEQSRAIELRGENILLSAAAGSGKTTVLVERVLRLIGEGADVDRMLVVTFTRAAAADMRAKLSRQLNARAAAGDARCRDQLLRLERASISTIHAFCAQFLRENFETAGVDPAFRVLDDAVNARLRDEALDEALEAAYGEADETLLALDYGRGPKGVRAALELLFARMEERPDPEEWLARAVRCDDEALSRWQDEIRASATRAVRAARVQLLQALEIPGCPDNYAAAIRADADALRALESLEDYDALYRALDEYTPTRAASRRGQDVDEGALDAVKRLRDAARRALADARILALPLSTARADAAALAGQLETLGRLALRAREIYEEKKAAQSGLTYADLEHRTLRALRNPGTAAAVRERFDHIFVDEYQDTSDLQEALIAAICRENNRFMVGDVKQSIYRFRLAEPRLFLEKYADYGAGRGGVLLPLTRNFRSRPGILAFVNLVFERAMVGGDTEILYDDLARLNAGDAGAPLTGDVDIRLIDLAAEPEIAPDDEAAAALAELKNAEREAILIADGIRKRMAADPSLRYRDFAILTRSRGDAFTAMLPVLLAHGIPAYADGAMGYYDSMELNWALSMLRLIANGRSDVELIGMLRSPAAGLDADELARVRIAYRDVPYCDAAARYAAERDDALAERLRAFFERLDQWRLKAGALGLGDFVRLILDESGFYTYAGALPGGAQRQANLDQFVLSACDFDREISGSLTRFLQYTEHLRQKGDADAAHILSENDDVVRMMTIHKSKGLEFRVVFGALLARRYRVERQDAPLVAHRDLGVGMGYVDPALRTRRVTLPQAAIIERQKREDAAEELRILYVLLTRARDQLVLTGCVRGADRARRRWEALSGAIFAASSHLDVIMAACCRAEREGLPTHSSLDILPAVSLVPDAAPARDGAAAQFERVMADPDAFAQPELERAMAWRYPDELAARRPLKLTASGLIRELEGPEQLPTLTERPAFLSEDARRMTATERGTAYHRAMQLLDFAPLAGLSGPEMRGAVARQLDGFANRRLMTDAQREVVAPEKLAAFLESPMGLRLRRAQIVRREWPFNAMLRAEEALTVQEAGRFAQEELLVQGTIDCCFIEDGAWILLDYKTDRADDPDALRDHYRAQLHVYALALERITGLPVRERALCLISINSTLDV